MINKIGIKEILQSEGSSKIKVIKFIDFIFGGLISFLLPPRKEHNIDIDTIKSILVIRPGGMGDAIFLLAVLKIVKAEHNDVEIDILCETRNKDIFKDHSRYFRKLYAYNKPTDFIKVFKNRYDVVVDTEQWHLLSALVAYFLNPKFSVGFNTRGLRKKLFNKTFPYYMNQYELDNFINLFGGYIKSKGLLNIDSSYEISNDNELWAEDKIPNNSIALSLAGSIPQRRLSVDQAIEIIKKTNERGYTVLLMGGRDVLPRANQIKSQLPDAKIINLVNLTTLNETAAAIKASNHFIGTDSGLLHLACSVGTSTISIFGTGNISKWGPKGNQHEIIKEENTNCCTLYGYTVLPNHLKQNKAGAYVNQSYLNSSIMRRLGEIDGK